MITLMFCAFLGFKLLDSMLHLCVILLYLFILYAIYPFLCYARSNLELFSDSFAASPEFRREIP